MAKIPTRAIEARISKRSGSQLGVAGSPLGAIGEGVQRVGAVLAKRSDLRDEVLLGRLDLETDDAYADAIRGIDAGAESAAYGQLNETIQRIRKESAGLSPRRKSKLNLAIEVGQANFDNATEARDIVRRQGELARQPVQKLRSILESVGVADWGVVSDAMEKWEKSVNEGGRLGAYGLPHKSSAMVATLKDKGRAQVKAGARRYLASLAKEAKEASSVNPFSDTSKAAEIRLVNNVDAALAVGLIDHEGKSAVLGMVDSAKAEDMVFFFMSLKRFDLAEMLLDFNEDKGRLKAAIDKLPAKSPAKVELPSDLAKIMGGLPSQAKVRLRKSVGTGEKGLGGITSEQNANREEFDAEFDQLYDKAESGKYESVESMVIEFHAIANRVVDIGVGEPEKSRIIDSNSRTLFEKIKNYYDLRFGRAQDQKMRKGIATEYAKAVAILRDGTEVPVPSHPRSLATPLGRALGAPMYAATEYLAGLPGLVSVNDGLKELQAELEHDKAVRDEASEIGKNVRVAPVETEAGKQIQQDALASVLKEHGRPEGTLEDILYVAEKRGLWQLVHHPVTASLIADRLFQAAAPGSAMTGEHAAVLLTQIRTAAGIGGKKFLEYLDGLPGSVSGISKHVKAVAAYTAGLAIGGNLKPVTEAVGVRFLETVRGLTPTKRENLLGRGAASLGAVNSDRVGAGLPSLADTVLRGLIPVEEESEETIWTMIPKYFAGRPASLASVATRSDRAHMKSQIQNEVALIYIQNPDANPLEVMKVVTDTVKASWRVNTIGVPTLARVIPGEETMSDDAIRFRIAKDLVDHVVDGEGGAVFLPDSEGELKEFKLPKLTKAQERRKKEGVIDLAVRKVEAWIKEHAVVTTDRRHVFGGVNLTYSLRRQIGLTSTAAVTIRAINPDAPTSGKGSGMPFISYPFEIAIQGVVAPEEQGQ